MKIRLLLDGLIRFLYIADADLFSMADCFRHLIGSEFPC